MMQIDPQGDVTQLKGVGLSLQNTLAKLGIFRALDILLHLPSRYQDRSTVTPLSQLRPNEEYLVSGAIAGSKVVFGKSRSLEVLVTDADSELRLRFFHFSKFQQRALENANYIQAFGSTAYIGRHLAMAHPEYRTFTDPPPAPKPQLVPVYPTTQGLSQNRLRQLTASVCAQAWPETPGTPFSKLKLLHQPDSLQSIPELRAELALEELAAYYTVMKRRALKRKQQTGIPLPRGPGLGRTLRDSLPFKLTKAQRRVIGETLIDLENETPMLRLVQGDVGSGKTIVAAFAALRAAEQGCQTAIMAPTELLAEQHLQNFQTWLEPMGLRVALLTGQMTAAASREAIRATLDGELDVVIGTHALFQDRVTFPRLALVIIDEQHRFGVHQRMALRFKGLAPHQLVMTATPIPRTLTMALYADMDVSLIDELPPGRQAITTQTIAESNRPKVIERIRQTLKQGQQAYWVCTLIDPSEEIPATAATEAFEDLQRALPEFRIGLLHGRLRGEEKVAIMRAFKNHELDLLVATTVIEVGVDVGNATQMVIENSERLGLAQLHQLRGRVGRGSTASGCFLLFKPGLGDTGKRRLNALRESQDGFFLAERDLEIRGPGDVLGTRQSGEQSFHIADLAEHAHLMPEAISLAEALMGAAPGTDAANRLSGLLDTWAPAQSDHLSA